MGNRNVLDIQRVFLRALLVSSAVLISSIIVGFFASALSSYPMMVPFGNILGLLSAIATLFPWEFADLLLKTCQDPPPQCDTEAALFQLTVVSGALAFIFYACVGFLLGLLRQCVTVSIVHHRNIVLSVTKKEATILLCIALCILCLLFIIGTILNFNAVQ
jgi:hypothetical protein